MTNKEAIEQIEGMRFQVQSSLDEVEVDVDSKEAEEDNRKLVEAFNMAIKALEREESVLKALEDVRAEITGNLETIIGKYDSNTKPEDMPSRKLERNNGRTEAIDIINRKIAEVKGDRLFRYAKEIIETQSPPSEGVNGEEFEKWLREGDKND